MISENTGTWMCQGETWRGEQCPTYSAAGFQVRNVPNCAPGLDAKPR